jgi:hypothetical protein
MAAYSKNITAAGMKLLFESMSNVNDKEILYSIIDTLNTEYAKMASDTLGSYTVTSGLQATLEAKLRRMGDSVKVEILKSCFVVLVAEYTSVQTLGLSYVQTGASATAAFERFEDLLYISLQNLPALENRIMFGFLIVQIIAEHVLLVAAS